MTVDQGRSDNKLQKPQFEIMFSRLFSNIAKELENLDVPKLGNALLAAYA
jgi:hypothetical protein